MSSGKSHGPNRLKEQYYKFLWKYQGDIALTFLDYILSGIIGIKTPRNSSLKRL